MKPDPRVKAIAARIEKRTDWALEYGVVKSIYRACCNDAARDILAYLARCERTGRTRGRKKKAT